MAFIIDEHNFGYFDELPPEARIATLDDFHWKGRRHSMMPFICKSPSSNHYVIYRFFDSIPAGRLKFFIDLNLVYLIKPLPQCVSDYFT